MDDIFLICLPKWKDRRDEVHSFTFYTKQIIPILESDYYCYDTFYCNFVTHK